jgi:hypothetical protein
MSELAAKQSVNYTLPIMKMRNVDVHYISFVALSNPWNAIATTSHRSFVDITDSIVYDLQEDTAYSQTFARFSS